MFMTPALPGVNGFNDGEKDLTVINIWKEQNTTAAHMNTWHRKYEICLRRIGTPDESVENGVKQNS